MNLSYWGTVFLLIMLSGFIGGCHYGLADRYRDYGGYGSYRDGYRDGRDYERQREQRRHSGEPYDYRSGGW